ncbi:SusD family protein [Chitinophaga rupis]|uniref:SusD family protein n=1 Tax=Chitinophaga rupis TaxID=573321 RepID=A0A1H7XXV8_9BACT|nr:RagB/SusD family nutrient uptake outer membrane protein [Chitinophaga rupis]SEM38762.1 SusD family protein [Chitinophaga rupis]
MRRHKIKEIFAHLKQIVSAKAILLWIIYCIMGSVFLTACAKLVEVNAPVTSTSGPNVYQSDPTAIAVMTNIYARISSASFGNGGLSSLSLFPGLSSDELTLHKGLTMPGYEQYRAFYTNNLTSLNMGGADYWSACYPIIFICNAAINGLNTSAALTPSVKQQLLGEAKFVRAFCYFYLVNLYGDVPLVLSTDYSVTASLGRTPQTDVWAQIIADLNDAKKVLSADFVDITLLNVSGERVRPTKWAAIGLLARAYLYTKKWDSASLNATDVINETGRFQLLGDLNSVFNANSNETIWQIQPVNLGQNTPDGRFFVLPDTGPDNDHPVYLSRSLLNSFENSDRRRENWIGAVNTGGIDSFYYPHKYKISGLDQPVTEYETILRLSEQYLIRAEARAQQGNIQGAVSDLNLIRLRAGLIPIQVTTKEIILNKIYHERRVELFTEWGHRWLDLKRTNTIDAVMANEASQKEAVWSNYKQLYPISLGEIQNGINLKQNLGY